MLIVLICCLLLISTSSTLIKHSQSGVIDIDLTGLSYQNSVGETTALITYTQSYEYFTNQNVKILLGIAGVSLIPDINIDIELFFEAINITITNFVLKVKHNYTWNRRVRASYMSLIESDSLKIHQNQLLQQSNIKQYDDANGDIQHNSIKSYKTVIQFSQIDSSFKALIWIQGYRIKPENTGIYFELSITIDESNKYNVWLKLNEYQLKIRKVYYNSLFFKQATYLNQNINYITSGSFTTYQEFQNQLHLQSAIIFGFNNLSTRNVQNRYFFVETQSYSLAARVQPSLTSSMVFTYANMNLSCDITCNTCSVYHQCITCNQIYLDTYPDQECGCPQGYRENRGDSYSCSCNIEDYRYLSEDKRVCYCHSQLQQYSVYYQDSNKNYKYSCYYFKNYSITVTQPQNIVKYQNDNIVEFVVVISPALNRSNYFVSNIKLSDIIVLNLSQPYSIETNQSSNTENDTLLVKLTFNELIQNKPIKVSLNLSANTANYSHDVFTFSQVSSSYFVAISPSTGLLSNSYPLFIYQQAQILPYIIYPIFAGVIIAIVLGFVFTYSLPVLQMTSVLQLTYFGTAITGSYWSPLLLKFSLLKFYNGFNFNIQNEEVNQWNLKHMNWSIPIINNLNLMAILFLIPLFIAVIYRILSKVYFFRREKYATYYRQLLGGCFYYSLIFLTYNCFFSLGVFVRNYNVPLEWFIGNIVLISFFSATLLAWTIFYIFSDFYFFRQFKCLTKVSSFAQKYYIIPVLQRMMIGFILGYQNDSFVSGIIALVILVAGGTLVAVTQPYSIKENNTRVIINYTIAITIMVCYVVLSFQGEIDNVIIAFIPNFILLLNIICVAICIKSVVSQVWTSKAKRYIEEAAFQHEYRIHEQNMIEINRVEQELHQTLEKGRLERVHGNFAQKMAFNKLKLRKKKKVSEESEDRVNQIRQNIECIEEVEEIRQNQGLTPERISMLDELLKRGEV